MARIRATNASGGGGTAQFTLLWTNPNTEPYSSFNEQDITLSQSLDDFDMICILYQVSGTNYTRGYADVSAFKAAGNPSSGIIVLLLGSTSNARKVTYVNSTTIHVTNAQRFGQSGSGNGQVPHKVYGVTVNLGEQPTT